MFKLKALTLCIVFLTLTQTSIAQKTISVIPFKLTSYNNIAIEAILNEKDTVQLMFHTAANGITLTEESTKKLKSLNFDGNLEGIKSWGGQDNSSRLSKANTLRIGQLKWSNLSIWENKNSGQETDGKFGIDFFKGKIIAINFDKKVITLYDELPLEAKKYEKLKLINENENLFLVADCIINNHNYKNKFLIHSGYAGAILFDDQFTAENKLGELLKIVSEKALKDSFGNILKTKNAIVPMVKIGKMQLTNVPAGFFEGAIGRQKMSIIGGDVLKRFNLIIDQINAYVYLIPNQLTRTAYKTV